MCEDDLLSQSSEASSDSKHERKDTERGMDGHKRGSEPSSGIFAAEEDEEAEEAHDELQVHNPALIILSFFVFS